MYIEKDGVESPFHDIPLFVGQNQDILNMIVEVPRWTNAKMEISKEEPFNPIKQDIKRGRLRYVRNCFPHHGYIWNYGAFPQVRLSLSMIFCDTVFLILEFQTWEDPNQSHAETKAKGDNDPLDVCEIGEQVGYTGQIKQVKVLGIMALLDEGETDWKIIVVDVMDPLAPKLNDIEDIERHLPGLIRATNEWFRYLSPQLPWHAFVDEVIGSTKSLMASRRILLPSLVKPKTKNMPWKSSMNATKLGVA